jgi:hypothetical protein
MSPREEEYRAPPLGVGGARGAPANLPDDERAAPLAWAARQGHAEIAEILRKHGVAR